MSSGSFLFYLVLSLVIVVPVFALVWLRWSFVTAQPDEWLLRIRDGQLVKSGIGISLRRRPGDLIARFSSTVQRVGFKVEALTQERLHVLVEGFVLWSVSPEGDGPFQAFRNLGLANLNDHPPSDLTSKKHLLSKQQYCAFQDVFAAEVQRYAATATLDELMIGQDKFVAGVKKQLIDVSVPLGIRIEQFQLLQVQPVDSALLRALSTRYEEQARENAAQIHLETAERMKRRELDSATSLARMAHGQLSQKRYGQAYRIQELGGPAFDRPSFRQYPCQNGRRNLRQLPVLHRPGVAERQAGRPCARHEYGDVDRPDYGRASRCSEEALSEADHR
jgi:regulator of protease activity HflC (stomatin/prohibitin superfamily)